MQPRRYRWTSPRSAFEEPALPDTPIIAIVDDDHAMREALADLLRSYGYSTALFVSAEHYLATADPGKLACMILDVRMTGMSGVDLQKALAARGHAPPIIFVTSYFDDKTRNAAIGGGAHAFLEKPVDDDALIDSLKSAIEATRSV